MLIAVLIVLNMPVFLFLGWLAFDSTDRAATTIFETIVAVLKQIFIPWSLRVLMGIDTSDAIGIVPIAGYLFACWALVMGELWVLRQWGWA